VHAGRELAEQCGRVGIVPEIVVVATGSGGTQAGLVAAKVGFGLPWRVIGASVSRPADEAAEQILRLSRACAHDLGVSEPTSDDVEVRDLRGPGFGKASDEDRISAELALTCEGLLLDDYYGSKSMTLLRVLLASHTDATAVFWHTGGVVAALTALRQGAPL
jgi:D-cysteine desulfhydrase